MKRLLFLPLLLLAEIDPFNAGVNSGYGLTPTEKAIVKNRSEINILKKELQNIKKSLKSYKVKLISYDETINNLSLKLDAFKTILSELDSAKADIVKLKKERESFNNRVESLELKVKNLENNITSLKSEIDNIKTSLKEITKIQNENFLYLRSSIEEILKKLKNLNRPLAPKEAMDRAKKYFYAGELDKAKELFLYTLSKKYLPATSAYYLGEIEFKKKNYKKALAYYKKSVEIYPKKASFTPRLLYHTALAFEKVGNKRAAKLTLEKLIRDYKGSKYANLAKKELEKLK